MAGDIKLTGTACRPRAFVKSNAVQHAGWIRMAGVFPIQVVILTAILMSNGCDGKSNDTPVSSDARVLSIGTSGLPTIEMSESEFSNWLLKRSRFEEHLQLSPDETRINRLPPARERFAYVPVLSIRLPDREELFISRDLNVELSAKVTPPSDLAASYFPETTRYFCRWKNDSISRGNEFYDPQYYENIAIPSSVFSAMVQLPLVTTLGISGGRFEHGSVREIASHPGIADIYLGRCVFPPDIFSQLKELHSLESLAVITGASPEWFTTLAKLPRFRKFFIAGKTLGEVDLNQPASEDAQRAIESMNGTLEEFDAAESYGIIVHADVAKALFKVKSLRKLRIDEVGPGLNLNDLAELLDMPNLLDISVNVGRPEYWGDDYLKARAIVEQAHLMAMEHQRAANSSKQ